MKKLAMLQMAGFLFLLILLVFCFTGVGSGGAGSVASPMVAFATEKEAYAYQYIGSELGVPWDIIMLADGMHAYEHNINTLKDYNPMLTSLEFCILMEEEQKRSADVSEGDAETYTTGNIYYYTGKEEILGYIAKDENKLTYKDSTGIINSINKVAEEKSTDDVRYVATLTVNEEYEEVLRNYIGLNEETIAYVMDVYASGYLISLYGYTVDLPDNIELPEIIQGNVTRSDLAKVAVSLINWPYMMGGKSNQVGTPKGALDCSGYVDWVYYQCFGHVVSGGSIPKGVAVSGTAQQWYACQEITEDELQVGDLGFLRDPAKLRKGQVNHVGIYLGKDAAGNRYWIHCGGKGYKTSAAPNGRVGISLNKGKNSYNPVNGVNFSPEMNSCNFTFFRRPQFAFQ